MQKQLTFGGSRCVPELIFLIAIMNSVGVLAAFPHHITHVTIEGLGHFKVQVSFWVYLSSLIILVHPTYN